MIYKILFASIILIIAFSLSSCDKGIAPGEPPSGPAGFAGKVTFVGEWPEGITRTHLVVFKNSIQSSSDFFPPNLTFIVDSIPYRSTEFTYNSIDNNFVPIFKIGEDNYSYVVVAQSKAPEISLDRKDWFVVGVYCINGDQTKPKTLTIYPGEITPDVNIVVDFNNPPPQPPE